MTIVTVAGLQFLGGEGTEGFFIAQDGLRGWDDGVDMRMDLQLRPQSPGAFDAPSFPGARMIELQGDCVAATPAQMRHFSRRLSGLLAGGERGRFTVQEEDLTLWADVRRLDKPDFRQRVWGYVAEFSIQFVAVDPKRYGDRQDFTRPQYQAFSAWHYGNATASPVYVIDGDLPNGYELQGPNGRRFRVTLPVQPGYPHSIDMLTGLLRIGGAVSTSGGIVYADTWRIAAGQQVTQRLAPIGGVGTATLTAQVTDTYL